MTLTIDYLLVVCIAAQHLGIREDVNRLGRLKYKELICLRNAILNELLFHFRGTLGDFNDNILFIDIGRNDKALGDNVHFGDGLLRHRKGRPSGLAGDGLKGGLKFRSGRCCKRKICLTLVIICRAVILGFRIPGAIAIAPFVCIPASDVILIAAISSTCSGNSDASHIGCIEPIRRSLSKIDFCIVRSQICGNDTYREHIGDNLFSRIRIGMGKIFDTVSIFDCLVSTVPCVFIDLLTLIFSIALTCITPVGAVVAVP